MKETLIHFFSSGPFAALTAGVITLLITILLVAKRWIGFSTALILLLIGVAATVLINNPQLFEQYTQANFSKEIEQQESFNKHLMEAIEGMKTEIQSEKENIVQLKGQVEEMVVELNNQKQKVENFIEETKKHFQPDEKEPIKA